MATEAFTSPVFPKNAKLSRNRTFLARGKLHRSDDFYVSQGVNQRSPGSRAKQSAPWVDGVLSARTPTGFSRQPQSVRRLICQHRSNLADLPPRVRSVWS